MSRGRRWMDSCLWQPSRLGVSGRGCTCNAEVSVIRGCQFQKIFFHFHCPVMKTIHPHPLLLLDAQIIFEWKDSSHDSSTGPAATQIHRVWSGMSLCWVQTTWMCAGIFSLSHWRQCAGTYRLPFAGGPVVLVFPCLLHDGWSSVLSWKEVNGKPQVTSMNSVRGIIQQSWIQKNEEMPSPINILTQSTPKTSGRLFGHPSVQQRVLPGLPGRNDGALCSSCFRAATLSHLVYF